jgi:hypothetical protein
MSATAMGEQQLKPYPALRLGLLVAGLLVAVILAGVASYYASSDPDGLTNVAQEQGFATESESATADSPLAGTARAAWSRSACPAGSPASPGCWPRSRWPEVCC